MKANEAPETYPIQFKDKIDKYLWEEHHILGGCCSSTESMKYTVAREIVEKLTDAFIEKATLWLLTNASDYCILHNSYDTKELVKDFVDAMKRE